MQDFRWLRDLWLGRRLLGQVVERPTALPATGHLFTVSGGRIIVTSIVGEITTALDANPTDTRLTATPTVGTATDMCAAGTDIASYALGDLLGITGVPGDTLVPAVSGGSIPAQLQGVVVKAGFIDMNVAAPGQALGRVRWTLHYIPLDAGASVAAA